MLCHLDDRNYKKIKNLAEIFSEFSLTKTRLLVEIKYLLALKTVGVISGKIDDDYLLKIWDNFNDQEFSDYKNMEKRTNHDIKALEYYLRKKLTQLQLFSFLPFIHFGLTSEDINNLSFGVLIKLAKEKLIVPRLKNIIIELQTLAEKSRAYPMLGRTHGQPAAGTTFGKEVTVFVKRLGKELAIFQKEKVDGKLNGSVGNYNALKFCFPKVDWLKFSEKFVESFRLEPNLATTQILPYDSWIRHFDCQKRINNILLGLVTDFWWYASFGYLKLKAIKKEVGSSAMPHKVNPIDLEAAEGNLGFSNSMLGFFSDKLSRTRLQRDLSDSTVRRNVGLALGYSYFAYDSILRALGRIEPDQEAMLLDLNHHWEILAEAYQNILKLNGYENAYEELKKLTRGRKITQEILKDFLDKIKLDKNIKDKLLKLKPADYLGLAKNF